jgi:hypothetical protein
MRLILAVPRIAGWPCVSIALWTGAAWAGAPEGQAGRPPGVILHVAEDDRGAALDPASEGRTLVYVLATQDATRDALRSAVRRRKLEGLVTIETRPSLAKLPLATHYANELWIDDLTAAGKRGLSWSEALRVVVPGGCVRAGQTTADAVRAALRAASIEDQVREVLPDGPKVRCVRAVPRGMGEMTHAPLIDAGARGAVMDSLHAKRNFPGPWTYPEPDGPESLEAQRQSLWLRWLDDTHRNTVTKGQYHAVLVAGGCLVTVSGDSSIGWVRDGAYWFGRSHVTPLVVRDAFNGVVRWSRPCVGGAPRALDLETGKLVELSKVPMTHGYGAWPCSNGGLMTAGLFEALSSRPPAQPLHDLIGHLPIGSTCRVGAAAGYHTVYQLQQGCGCYVGRLRGLLAASPIDSVPRREAFERPGELDRGPAYDLKVSDPAPLPWPTFRADAGRSCGGAAAPSSPRVLWRTPLASLRRDHAIARHTWRAQHLYYPVISAPALDGARAYVALPYEHQVVALDAATGAEAWRRRLFPVDERVNVYGQLESRYPVTGSVLIDAGAGYATAGISGTIGMMLCRFDPISGDVQAYRRMVPGVYHNDALVRDDQGRIHLGFVPIDAREASELMPPGRDKRPAALAQVDGLLRGKKITPAHLFGWDSEILSTAKSCSPVGQGYPSPRKAGKETPWMAPADLPPAVQCSDGFSRSAHLQFLRHGARALNWAWTDRYQIGLNQRSVRPGGEGGPFNHTSVAPGAVFALERNALAGSGPVPPLWSRSLGEIWAVALAADRVIAGGPVVTAEPPVVEASDPRWKAVAAAPTLRDPLLAPGRIHLLEMATGKTVAAVELPSAPIQDGIALSARRLFVSTADGSLFCLGDN